MQNVEQIKKYIDHGLNILLQGKHGTGKTTVLTQAADELGLKVAYYSASTMDPWADFVGVPVPEELGDGSGRKTLTNVRPHRIDEAEVAIFDELNRADPKVLNAVLELVQFRTINGERLPNLKCVVAAQNPPEEGYNVDTLDEALVDRFDIMINVEPDITVAYLAGVIGDRRIATHFINWWKQRSAMSEKASYISPRRLEKMARLYIDFEHNFDVLKAALPPGNHDFGKLRDMLDEPTDPDSINRWYAEKSDATSIRTKDTQILENEFKVLGVDNRAKVVDALKNHVGGANLFAKYLALIEMFTTDELESLTANWGPSKKFQVKKAYNELSDSDKAKLPTFETILMEG